VTDAKGISYAIHNPANLAGAIMNNPAGAARSFIAPAMNNFKHGNYAAGAGDINWLVGSTLFGGKGAGALGKAAVDAGDVLKTANAVRKVGPMGLVDVSERQFNNAISGYGRTLNTSAARSGLWNRARAITTDLNSGDPSKVASAQAAMNVAVDKFAHGWHPFDSLNLPPRQLQVPLGQGARIVTDMGVTGNAATVVGFARGAGSTGLWAKQHPDPMSQWDNTGAYYSSGY
jgi:hypothetical protein